MHIHHGVGRYTGLSRLKLHDFEGEYAVVEYQHADKIYIPIEQLTRIYKYTGAHPSSTPFATKMGTTQVKVKAVKMLRRICFFSIRNANQNEDFRFLKTQNTISNWSKAFPFRRLKIS